MDDKMPLVCICIPAYNAEKTIERTLESLVKQTYKNIIIKIINNNSSDRTPEIAEKYAKQYANITTYNFDITVPGEENFDRCLQLSEGDYTCLFHSDDVYDSHIIEREVSTLQGNDSLGAVFTCANIIDENDNIVDQMVSRDEFQKNKIYTFDDLFPIILRYGMCFVTPSAMVRTEVYKRTIQKHQRYKSFGGASDADTWIRILKVSNVMILQEKLINYRMSMASYSYRNLLVYKNTLSDCLLRVLEHNINEINDNSKRYKYVDILAKFKTKILLDDAYKAIICGDFEYARDVLEMLNGVKMSFRYLCKKKLYAVLANVGIPQSIRKMLIYKKYHRLLSFDDIDAKQEVEEKK